MAFSATSSSSGLHRFAKENGIPVGPGPRLKVPARWCVFVVSPNIDPIVNKLLFERFLNSERVSIPDFDVDFCMNRRDEVIAYVTENTAK